jgi:serum/glucocorticoid-regulated kinase 2
MFVDPGPVISLLAKKIQPPFKPSVVRGVLMIFLLEALLTNCFQESVLDVANFDPDFTNEEAQDSVVTDSALSETVQDQFRGFTYNPANEHLSESVSYPAM